MVKLRVLIRFPSVKTATEDPWMSMEDMTMKVTMGQTRYSVW